jgi:hypothetical protein
MLALYPSRVCSNALLEVTASGYQRHLFGVDTRLVGIVNQAAKVGVDHHSLSKVRPVISAIAWGVFVAINTRNDSALSRPTNRNDVTNAYLDVAAVGHRDL